MWVKQSVGFVGIFLIVIPIWIHAQSLTDLLKRHKELSKFLELVRGSPFLNASLPWRQGTLFAPTNAAVDRHLETRGKIDNYTLLYHFANVAKRTTDLEDTLSSELPGNSPIWITRKSESEIYLNDARVDGNMRNFQVKNSMGMDQVLHVIDRVLDPSVPDSSDSNLLNPDARKFLENSSSYNITGPHRITKFAMQVAIHKKLDMFRNIGRHTFFIPVDSAFENIREASVDSKVIDGHVIPNHVIFLRPSELRRQFETAAFSSSLPVFVEFDQSESNGEGTYIVRSDTRSADGDSYQYHRKGVVQTEVVQGNIPVKNGVVHLISKPLVVINSTVYQTLENEKEDGPTYEFFQLIKNHATEDLRNLLRNHQSQYQNRRGRGITVFVPNNEVLKGQALDLLKFNSTELDKVLKLHIILDTVTSDNITETNERTPLQVETAAGKQLFFNYHVVNGRRVFFVEGGGVNATITQPDVGATDGVIHMIDRPLGYANQNIYEKLRTDPMLQQTFKLSSQDNFNERFNNSFQRFTLFAPSNLAWEKIYRVAPSEYRKLQMGGFGYHVARILERHMIVNRAFTIEQLRELSKNSSEHTYPILAVHGALRIENKEDLRRRLEQRPYSGRGDYRSEYSTEQLSSYEYSVNWMTERAHVVRPDIVCTNGIIHIIDEVLMRPADVTVAYVSSMSGVTLIFPSLILTFSFLTLVIFNSIAPRL